MLDKLQQILVLLIHAIVFTLVFQVALCVSWMFKLSSSPVFVDCSKMCIDRESNPGLSRGRRQFYHWTIDAWQIATISGSFQTCNLFQVGFPGCSVFVESSIYRALLFLLIVQKMCIDRHSNPCLSRGRRQIYHWTIDAWQIATNTGSFYTYNRIHICFSGCSLCKLNVQIIEFYRFCWLFKNVHRPGTEPGSIAWQAKILPLNHRCLTNCNNYWFLPYMRSIPCWFSKLLCVCWMFNLPSSPDFVDCSKNVHRPGIEPGSIAWQATILPLNHRCLTNCNDYWFLSYMQSISSCFPGCSVFVESSIYRALLFLLIVQKMCIDRHSNPCLSRGRRQIYHWTIDAWHIATNTGSFYTYNRIHICFSGCSLCKLNVQIIEFSRFCWLFKNVHRQGTEPGSIAWQAKILLLNHRCLTNCNNYWFLPYMRSIPCWFSKLLCVCWMFNLPSSPDFVDCSKNAHRPGIEPGSIAWQATILPLNHRCLTNCNDYWFLSYMQSISSCFPGCSV